MNSDDSLGPPASPQAPVFARPEQVPVRSAWPNEARDFTPWLAKNLWILDDLDIGHLELVNTEVTLPETGRSLDILAELADGRRVAIENQFATADHDHLTRGLAYAVGMAGSTHRVVALVVIAEGHRPEFVAIADYLNRAAEQMGPDGICIFLVQLHVEKLDHYLIPRVETLSQPNEWRRIIAEDDRSMSLTDLIARMPAAAAEAATQIIDAWHDRSRGSIIQKSPKAVSLYLANPAAKSGMTSVFVVYEGGALAVNAGYIIESGLLATDEEVAELHELIHEQLPSHTTGERNYYYNGPLDNSSPSAVRMLADWIDARSVRMAGGGGHGGGGGGATSGGMSL